MVWDRTPWFVGGDAKHSEEVARVLAFMATGGTEGVTLPGDLKVVPSAPPSGTVVVSAGACVIRNRGANSYEQSYIPWNPDGDPVDVAPTGATNGRSDLIVARVEDLNAVGGSQWENNGADPADGPFVFTRVIPNVPAGTTSLQDVTGHANDVAIALARIDIPANTATITAGMITDLRKLSRPRTDSQNGQGTLTGKTLTLSLGWQTFPENPVLGFTVPDWATHAVVTLFTSVSYQSGDARAQMQTFMTTSNGPLDGTTLCSDQQLDFTTGNGYRQAVVIPSQGDWALPAAIRGKPVQLVTRVKGLASGGKISTGASDYYTASVTFKEKAA